MSDFSWIMSEGGPLICLEEASAASWGGVQRLSVKKPGAATDYDRACDGLRKWLTSAPLEDGAALFFQGPFDTSFWQRAQDGKLFVVRIEACEIDTNFEAVMNDLDETMFESPIENLSFTFKQSDLIMFDSAEEGNEVNKKSVRQKIGPGTYNIITSYYETEQLSLLFHRFDRQP